MLSLKYRPQTFDEIEGQEIPKKVLKKVVDKPENNLRVFYFKVLGEQEKPVLQESLVVLLIVKEKINLV